MFPLVLPPRVHESLECLEMTSLTFVLVRSLTREVARRSERRRRRQRRRRRRDGVSDTRTKTDTPYVRAQEGITVIYTG